MVMKLIQIGNTLIVSSDHPEYLPECGLSGFRLLTCGLSLRATVTASSIGDEGFTYCLQRGILTLKNIELPPQEFNVRWRKKPEEIYPYLALVTLLLICGVPMGVLQSLEF